MQKAQKVSFWRCTVLNTTSFIFYRLLEIKKLGYHSVYMPQSQMNGQGAGGRNNGTLNEMLSLVQGGNFNFHECLDYWKIHLIVFCSIHFLPLVSFFTHEVG